MEKSEPTLVPEWLKNSGSSTAGSSLTHSVSRAVRNKSSVNSNSHDFGRSSSSERTTSSYFRRSSSNSSSGNFRSYSSFVRNQRDWEKDAYDSRDQDNSVLAGRRHRTSSDPLGENILGKVDRDCLRRSQSMISGKSGDTWPKKVAADSGSASVKILNGLVTKDSPVAGVSKATFERDFPSLGVDERAVMDTSRIPSLGLNTGIQSLPISTSTSLGGEKWISALAEVPMLVGSNGTASASVLQATSASLESVALGSTTSFNMAEAVAQGPTRAQTAPQLSIGAHRLEELAIKQSRQLIPVTPSIPKTLVLNSSDKLKRKVGSQLHSISSSVPVNQSPRGGLGKGDVLKASNVGKLHVLKPVREKDGVSSVVKDYLSPSSGGSFAASSPVYVSAATKGTPNNAVPDRKPVLTLLEKRPTSQARSRNDFFNLVRKKSLANPASASSATTNTSSGLDTGSAMFSSYKHAEMEVMPVQVPLSLNLTVDCVSEKKDGSISNGKKHCSSDPIISEEEEAAFLRSMGWEENEDEGGLTQEEISAFYRDLTKYITTKPSPRVLQLVQQKFMTPFESQLGGIDEKLEP